MTPSHRHCNLNSKYLKAGDTATLPMKHTVKVEGSSCSYASTCNGLVLVSSVSYPDEGQSSVDGVVFNPATKEEACLSLPLPHPQNKMVKRRILGFGYGPSSKVYKALIREDDYVDDATWLMVVTLDGSDGQEPRKVLSCPDSVGCCHSLHTDDGKVYFLIYDCLIGEEGNYAESWEVTSVLAFDVDDEVVTSIDLPQGNKDMRSNKMLHIRGRPCIYEHKGRDTVIWLLTPDHRWEQLYILVKESSLRKDYLVGAWDYGGGLLFAWFRTSGAYLYSLHETAVNKEEGSGNRLAALRSLAIEYEWPEPLRNRGLDYPANLLDYQPTLISPASIFGDARHHESVAPKHELDGMFLEMTQKCIVDPAVQMLANL